MPSLYRRLTITHTIVALLAVLVVAVLAGVLILRAYDQLAIQQASLAERTAVTLLSEFYRRRGSWQSVDQALQEIVDSRPMLFGRRVLVADKSWRVIFDSADRLTGQPAPLFARSLATPVQVRGQAVGHVAVLVGGENRTLEERTFARSIITIIVVGGLAGALIALLMGLLVARQITRPLRLLTAAARRIAVGERHEPLAVPAEAELAELAGAFNSMAFELGRQQELRRSMVADIAHELRTPLSVLRLQVESIEDGVAKPTPERLSALGQQIGLLSRLVDDLRLLSLADSGQLSLQLAALDPQALLADAAAVAAPRAAERGVALLVAPSPPLPAVRADPQRMAQILGNLVENALRYTPSGGSVTLNARRIENAELSMQNSGAFSILNSQFSICFEVADTGPGIDPADLPQIFERFYRADRARARETGGSGLGLAIVQRLVAAQGGSITAQSVLGQGSAFRVCMPLASSSPASRSLTAP